MAHLFLRTEVGTFLPLCVHRTRLAAIGAPTRGPRKPMAATPSDDETRAGADAGSPTGLTAGSYPACPHGPGPDPVA